MIHKKLISRLNLSRDDVVFLVVPLILAVCAAWSYFNLDQRVLSLLSQSPVYWHRAFWVKAFTYLGKAWAPIWLLLIWFLATGKQRPVLVVFLALIVVSLTVTPAKIAIRRPRPSEVIRAQAGLEERPHSNPHLSFPSGDTAVAFAIATTVASFVTWPLRCLLLAAAAGIALLRVTALKHYPSDVFAGAAFGSFAGWLAIQIDRRWLPLEEPRVKLHGWMAILSIAIIPFAFRLPRGIGSFVIFFETYGLLALCMVMATRARGYIEKIKALRFADSNHFDSILRCLKRRRTLALGIAFVIVIAENLIDGRKPHELAFDDGSVIAFVGLALVIAGTSIRLWARGHFVKGRLFTTGPYGVIRHPLYLGSFLIVVGVLFQLSGWLNWIVILSVFAVTTGAAIMYEERSLERLFGRQWQSYKARTPAIIPSLSDRLFPKEIGKWSWKVYSSTGELSRTLMFLCLPLLIELTEDLVFEGMFGL